MRCSFLSQQKMDKNKDGVVTIDEFIESCQKVSKEKQNLSLLLASATVSTANGK